MRLLNSHWAFTGKNCLHIYLTMILILIDISVGHEGHHHHHHEDDDEHTEASTTTEEAQTDKNSISSTSDSQTKPEWSTNALALKKMTGIDLKWDNIDTEYLTMEMSTRTTGYVSVGFCSEWHGTMEGCDIIIGWVDDDTLEAHLYDYHAINNEAPILDSSQDVELITATQNNSKTIIKFKRKWDTNDTLNDVELKSNQVQLIWSWHPLDPKSKDEIPPHDKNTRGHTTKMIQLATASSSGMSINLTNQISVYLTQSLFVILVSIIFI